MRYVSLPSSPMFQPGGPAGRTPKMPAADHLMSAQAHTLALALVASLAQLRNSSADLGTV
jgi:hypothetical protein